MKLITALSMSIFVGTVMLAPTSAFAVCADSIEVKLNKFTLPVGKDSWGSTPEFLGLVKTINSVVLKNVGENQDSGCMYESTDAAKAIFADFGKGELIVYPADMYSATIDVSKGDFQPGITRFYFDFAIDATPDLAITSARVGQHEVLESCSHGADTCRAEVGMQTYWDTTSYEITLQYGARKIVLKK